MNDVLTFIMPSDRIFHASGSLDLQSKKTAQLDAESPFILVCPTTFLCGYMHDNYLINKNATAYLNIEDAGDHSIFALFLHVQVDPPFIIDESGRQFITYLSEYISFPENNRVTQAIYGCVFTGPPETVTHIMSNFEKAGGFFVGLGAPNPKIDIIVTDEHIPIIKGTKITTDSTSSIITSLKDLPFKTSS